MKKLGLFLLSCIICLGTFLTACTSGSGDNIIVLEEGKTYSNQISTLNEDGSVAEKNYNSDLFYFNDSNLQVADPFVFQCTDETDTENYGKFFLYGTTTTRVYNCWESTDLVNWVQKAPAYTVPADGWEYDSSWAPEVVYDAEANREDYGLSVDDDGTGVYFMFYSATPCDRFLYFTYTVTDWQLGLAVSTSPYGPFKMWNGNEEGATIGGVNYGTREGYAEYTTYKDEWDTFGYAGRQGDTVTNDDSWFNQSAARASLAFQYANKDKAGNWVDAEGNVVAEGTPNATFIGEGASYMVVDESAGGMPCFDPHPYVDPVSGDKYLYFSVSSRGQPIFIDENKLPLFQVQSTYAVKMLNNDWAQIDYSSITRITRAQCNVVSQAAADAYVEDARNFDASKFVNGYYEGEDMTLTLDYADAEIKLSGTTGVNEGPTVIYNEDTGLYYLTCSVGQYTDGTYSVVQSVAYGPMGPFRKLTLAEGGVLLATYGISVTDVVSGPGHHSIVQLGDEMAIVYHSIANVSILGGRAPRIDRLTWIENENGMKILYANGPTKSPQLKFTGYGTDYANIASDASITVSSQNASNVSALNDGYLTMHDSEIHSFTKEFDFTDEKVTITLKFDDYRKICGIMVYNSCNKQNAFYNVAKVEMDAKIKSSSAKVVINNLAYDWDSFVGLLGIQSGTSAIAVFNEIEVKEISFVIYNYNIGDDASLYSGITSISEIAVIGLPN